MSEPVIKAFMADRMRGEDGQLFWREHFTRDDLVRAVAEAQDCVWVKNSYDEGATAVFDESPEHIVDRLTKVDV